MEEFPTLCPQLGLVPLGRTLPALVLAHLCGGWLFHCAPSWHDAPGQDTLHSHAHVLVPPHDSPVLRIGPPLQLGLALKNFVCPFVPHLVNPLPLLSSRANLTTLVTTQGLEAFLT